MCEAVGHPQDGGWGWVIVCCSFTIYGITMGIQFSLSILYVSWLDEFGTSKAFTSWIVSLCSATSSCIGLVAACLASRFGHQAVTIFGGLLSCMGFIISYFATNVPYLIVCIGVFTGAGFGCCIHCAVAVVAVYFSKRRSLAFGIGASGAGIGNFLMAPLFHWLNEEYGWRGALLIIGAICLHLSVCGLLMRPVQSISVQSISVKPTEVESFTDNQTDADQMHQNRYEVMKCNGPVVKLPKELSKSGAFPIETPEPLVDDGVSLLSPENDINVYKNASRQYNSDYLEAPVDETAVLGGSVQILHTSKPINQDRLARRVCSAMELRSPNSGAVKMYLKTGTSGNTGATLSMRDILMCGSLHSLALIDVKLPESEASVPETPRTASEVQTVTSSRPYTESVIKVFWSFFSSFTLLKNGAFAAFVISSILANLTYLMPVLYMVDRALDNGIDKTTATLLASLNGAGNLFGRFFFGFLSDRPFVDCLVCFIGCLSACGITTSLSPLCGSSKVLHGIYAILFGCFMGAFVTLTPVVTVELMGVSRVGEAFGLVLMLTGLAILSGSPLAGWIFDWTGSFTTSYVVFGIFALLSALIMLPVVYLRKCRLPYKTQNG